MWQDTNNALQNHIIRNALDIQSLGRDIVGILSGIRRQNKDGRVEGVCSTKKAQKFK